VRRVARRSSSEPVNGDSVRVVTPEAASTCIFSAMRSFGPSSAVASRNSYGHGRRRLVVLAGQVQVLHLRAGLVEAHRGRRAGCRSSSPGCPSADVQRGVAPDGVGARPAGRRRRRSARSARRRSPRASCRPWPAGLDLRELLLREVRRVEDRQPAVEQLARQLEVLRADGGEVHRDVLAHRVHRQLQRLAGPSGSGRT
jgi:hypothetical protein